MSDGVRIVTSRGTLLTNERGNAVIEWRGGAQRMNQRYSAIQKFIENTVVRHMNPFVPMRTGILAKSVVLGSRMGSGELVYIAPYSRKVYLGEKKDGTKMKFSKSRHPKATEKWAEHMKAARMPQIEREVQAYVGRLMP